MTNMDRDWLCTILTQPICRNGVVRELCTTARSLMINHDRLLIAGSSCACSMHNRFAEIRTVAGPTHPEYCSWFIMSIARGYCLNRRTLSPVTKIR